MVHLCSGVTAALAALSLLGSTVAIPLGEKLRSLTPEARGLLKRTVPAAPRFVVYSDSWVSPLPSAADLQGYNVYILGFWSTSGPTDMALAWQDLSPGERTNYLNEYKNAGISLMVSAFGETESPTTDGANPWAVGDHLAFWVLDHGLHGVDIDYEVLPQSACGAAEGWLIALTQQLRKHLPLGEYAISHAPVAPWFARNVWSGGGYLQVHWTVGHLIDWYNIQYYNQGANEYTMCHSTLWGTDSQWPDSGIFRIAGNGVDLNKLVIGKPAKNSDANNGVMDLGKLSWCVSVAHQHGWDAGVMVWEYPDATSQWIKTVRGSTF